MENESLLKSSMDDIVFDGRNKAMVPSSCRRLYDKTHVPGHDYRDPFFPAVHQLTSNHQHDQRISS